MRAGFVVTQLTELTTSQAEMTLKVESRSAGQFDTVSTQAAAESSAARRELLRAQAVSVEALRPVGHEN